MLLNKIKPNIIYTIGSIANSAALLLLVPYLINYLSSDEFGIWSLLEVTILILSMIISAGQDIGLMREYWPLKDENERATLSGSVFLTVFIWGIFLTSILFILNLLGLFSFLLDTSNTIIGLTLISALFESSLNLFLAVNRIRENALHYALISFGRLLFFMVISILLVSLGLGVLGAIAGRAVAGAIALFIGYVSVKKHFILTINFQYVKRVVKYGLPMLPANIAGYIILMSDRYFLGYFTGLTAVAIYSFAYKFVSVFDILINRPFALDFAPRRFKIANQNKPEEKYELILVFYVFISSFCVLTIIAIAPYAFSIIAPNTYFEGLNVLPILLLSAFIYGLSYPLTVGIVIKDKTLYAGIIGILTALVCLAINYILIPRLGLQGAALATLFSYSIWTTSMTIASLLVYPIGYSLKPIILILIISVITYFGLYWFSINLQLQYNSLYIFLIRLTWTVSVFTIAGLLAFKQTRDKVKSVYLSEI